MIGSSSVSFPSCDMTYSLKCFMELLDATEITPGTYDVICMPDVTGIIAHEAFGHGVHAVREFRCEWSPVFLKEDLIPAQQKHIMQIDPVSFHVCQEPADIFRIEAGQLRRGVSQHIHILSK